VVVSFSRAAAQGQPVQHKFRIERGGQGPDAGWEPGPNRVLMLDGADPQVTRVFGAPGEGLVARRTGQIVPLGSVPSAHVAAREVQVWLPPGYDTDAPRRHPVLYLHDGQNMFDALAAGAEWQVDETAQRLVLAGLIEPPIIVAVASGGSRMADYTPTAITLPAERTGTGRAERVGGGAAAYARFLIEELKPLVDRRWRTRPEPAATVVGGSSLGGLVSLWLALHRPQVFGAALVVSPSLWWDERLPLRDVQAWQAASDGRRPRLWLCMGGQEGAQALPEARLLQQALMARGWSADTLAYVEAPDGQHDEASWARRVDGMLRFLYGRPTPPR
jgi:predicted alpha/beta superfamily hydrolase